MLCVCGADDLHEISPYATFSMSSGAPAAPGAARCAAGCGAGARGEGEAARACALRLRSFARDPLQLAAPPPRPQLLAHPNGERLRPCFHAFSINMTK